MKRNIHIISVLFQKICNRRVFSVICAFQGNIAAGKTLIFQRLCMQIDPYNSTIGDKCCRSFQNKAICWCWILIYFLVESFFGVNVFATRSFSHGAFSMQTHKQEHNWMVSCITVLSGFLAVLRKKTALKLHNKSISFSVLLPGFLAEILQIIIVINIRLCYMMLTGV